MQDHVERSPSGQVEEAGKVPLQRRRAATRDEEEREDHRKHRIEDDRQHDVEERDPGHRLLRYRRIGVARLLLGTQDREGVTIGRAEVGARLKEGVDERALLENLLCGLRAAMEMVGDNRKVRNQLRARERWG